MNLGKSPGDALKQKNTHFFRLDLALCTGKGISDPLRDDQEGSQVQCPWQNYSNRISKQSQRFLRFLHGRTKSYLYTGFKFY